MSTHIVSYVIIHHSFAHAYRISQLRSLNRLSPRDRDGTEVFHAEIQCNPPHLAKEVSSSHVPHWPHSESNDWICVFFLLIIHFHSPGYKNFYSWNGYLCVSAIECRRLRETGIFLWAKPKTLKGINFHHSRSAATEIIEYERILRRLTPVTCVDKPHASFQFILQSELFSDQQVHFHLRFY